MNDDQLKTLDELLKDRLQEKKKIEKELSKNLNRIKEINTFLDSMTEALILKFFLQEQQKVYIGKKSNKSERKKIN